MDTHCLSISRSESRKALMAPSCDSAFVTPFFATPSFAWRTDISNSFTNLVLGVFSISYHSYPPPPSPPSPPLPPPIVTSSVLPLISSSIRRSCAFSSRSCSFLCVFHGVCVCVCVCV